MDHAHPICQPSRSSSTSGNTLFQQRFPPLKWMESAIWTQCGMKLQLTSMSSLDSHLCSHLVCSSIMKITNYISESTINQNCQPRSADHQQTKTLVCQGGKNSRSLFWFSLLWFLLWWPSTMDSSATRREARDKAQMQLHTSMCEIKQTSSYQKYFT